MTETSELLELAQRWRGDAALLSRRGLREAATLLESVVDDLDGVLQKAGSELLTLQEAASLSGYSVGHLGRRVLKGDIANAGRKGAPRIARRDLPLKSGVLAISGPSAELDCTQIVRSAIKQGAG